jgi:hypothetical protein
MKQPRISACFLFLLFFTSTARAALLDSSFLTMVPIAARDVVYDPTRNLVYASVPSTAGVPYGNTIISLDPVSHSIVGSVFVGSEPNRLAISSDASRVYVGIDGARSFTWWQTTNNTVGQLVPIKSHFGDPAIAQNLAVSPLDPSVVVVSKDEVGSTASGDLQVFQNSTSLSVPSPTFNDANEITFVNGNTLVSLDNADTSYLLARWSFTGSALSRAATAGSLITGFSTHIESHDGLIFASNGMVVNPATMALLGTFAVQSNSAVEPLSNPNRTYFVGPKTASDSTLTLQVFDDQTFVPLASTNFPALKITGSVVELVRAGDNAFAFVTSGGQLGFINVVPEPSMLVLGSILIASIFVFPSRFQLTNIRK